MRLLVLSLLILCTTYCVAAQQSVAISDLTVTLPSDWKGEIQGDESQAPYNASYVFENTNPESSLTGSTLVVSRVIGFDRVERERFFRGRINAGYGGLRAVAAVPENEMMFRAARGYKTEGIGLKGNIYFIQNGMTFYAVHITAPEPQFTTYLPEFIDILESIEFPAAESESNQVAN